MRGEACTGPPGERHPTFLSEWRALASGSA